MLVFVVFVLFTVDLVDKPNWKLVRWLLMIWIMLISSIVSYSRLY